MVKRLALLVFASLVFAPPVVAGNIGVTFGFKAGTLGARAGAVALGGNAVQVHVLVVDARGNGAGWSLGVAGSGSPVVTKITVRCAAHSTCTLPSAGIVLPFRIGSTPATILSAARDSGMGALELTLTVRGGTGPLSASVR